MKRLVMAALCAAIMIPVQSASSSWVPVNSTDSGFHEIIIQDKVDFFRQFSYLNVYRDNKEFVCADMSSGDCKTLTAARFNVILPVCASKTQLDCIVGLQIRNAKGSEIAVFEGYTMPTHPSLFKGDGTRLPASPQSPSVWESKFAGHSGGTKYAVHVGYDGGINRGKVEPSGFYAQLYAIEEVTGRGEEFDQYNFANFAWCDFNPQTRELRGCGSGGNVEGEICVVQFQRGGNCGAKREIPADTRFTLQLRLAKEPNGWYHGRLGDPSVSLAKSGKGVLLSVSGVPTEVPILYHSGAYSDMSSDLKRYWDDCAKADDCPKSTREFGADLRNQPGAARNITSEQNPWTPKAIETVKFFKSFNADSSPKLEQVWAVRSLQDIYSSGGQCYASKGFKGMVTTNATAYVDGPPRLVSGVLRYSVSAPRLLATDNSEIPGSYNLVMRNSFAACVYKSGKISPRAEVSVRGLAGDYRVSTSITSRNGQWVRLTAKNFEY